MALSLKARKRWSLVVLVIGLPLYIVVAVSIVALIPRPPILVELLIFVVLGFAWILPFKKLFTGVAAARPEDDETAE
ncbi:DUF2842 domain-containing protein [Maritimibacter sp. UBA3975]|uniref:DUF2842 domain-containing protein n=1 Tax=Maritimibacter sp. UBA3975 TaxID=1946833 RepID=UPI000C0AEED0|nr:DUF2842 domain-containing protein [Maritimibacter sp. UBA3975]MAM60964.1 hypothetical protein [Maritimibacter sp.]|tara:strand:+ start:14856 stop:15086 length:231 start_codon:yes stop_codon:yes gene_type:complete